MERVFSTTSRFYSSKSYSNVQLGWNYPPSIRTRRIMKDKSYSHVARMLHFKKIQSKCMKNVHWGKEFIA